MQIKLTDRIGAVHGRAQDSS